MMNGDNTPDGWTPFADIVAGVDDSYRQGTKNNGNAR